MQKVAATNKNNGNDTRSAFVSHTSDEFSKKIMMKCNMYLQFILKYIHGNKIIIQTNKFLWT